MRSIRTYSQFEKDLRKMMKRGKAVAKLWYIVGKLQSEEKLAPRYRAHKLVGQSEGFSDLF